MNRVTVIVVKILIMFTQHLRVYVLEYKLRFNVNMVTQSKISPCCHCHSVATACHAIISI